MAFYNGPPSAKVQMLATAFVSLVMIVGLHRQYVMHKRIEHLEATCDNPAVGMWSRAYVDERTKACKAICDGYAPCEKRCARDYNHCASNNEDSQRAYERCLGYLVK